MVKLMNILAVLDHQSLLNYYCRQEYFIFYNMF